MSKYIKGSKRLAIIQRWLQGIDDPEYDVLPTRKEGKYIVKKREQTAKEEHDESHDENESNEDIPTNEGHMPESISLDTESQTEKKGPLLKAPVRKPPIRKPTKQETYERTKFHASPVVDSTVNLEILEQIKLLGDEIKGQRERKEQKRMIQHELHKQFTKSPSVSQRSRNQPKETPEYDYEYDYEYVDEPQPKQPVFKSRIHP